MPRRARSYDKNIPLPDPKFGNTKYAKFINYLMLNGKKSVAQNILYNAFEIVEQKKSGLEDAESKSAQDIFDVALKNVAPIMEIKGRRIGGSNYQVPMEVQEPRRTALGMKWMINAARTRKGVPMAQKLAAEILDAFQKQGAAIKKREDTHRMAEANKAFAHFARFGAKRK